VFVVVVDAFNSRQFQHIMQTLPSYLNSSPMGLF